MTGQTSDETPLTRGRVSRRGALGGAATVGWATAAAPLLVSCADGGADGSAGRGAAGDAPAADLTSGSTTSTPLSEVTASADEALVAVEDIPVGGGVVFTDSRVVVTQPESGNIKCFSAVCTHEGCLVAGVTSTILCRCHQSSFDISTGRVLSGPAPAPLPAVKFTINNKNRVVLS